MNYFLNPLKPIRKIPALTFFFRFPFQQRGLPISPTGEASVRLSHLQWYQPSVQQVTVSQLLSPVYGDKVGKAELQLWGEDESCWLWILSACVRCELSHCDKQIVAAASWPCVPDDRIVEIQSLSLFFNNCKQFLLEILFKGKSYSYFTRLWSP